MKQQLSGEKTKISFYLRAAAALCLCVVFLVQPDCIATQGSEVKSAGGGERTNNITLNDQKAKDALDAALKALGGAEKIGEIKSLIIEGTESIISDQFKSNPQKFEIVMLLPDNFIHGQSTDTGRRAFSQGISNGAMLPPMNLFPLGKMKIEEAEELKKNPPKPTAEQIADMNTRVKVRQDYWSYYLIGLFAKAGPTPLTLSSGLTPGVFAMTQKDGEEGETESFQMWPLIVHTRPCFVFQI